ncbi:MAG: DUF4494 domain-containing protein [Paludibacteraceae bacterium]|nr:DUF4494 domain-containing protein [Paludibacteraceae bacterium]
MYYFDCKIKFEKQLEEGKVQKVSESYLIDALTFTEAEARIVEEMKPYISGEFEVSNIRRVRLSDIFTNSGGDKWYKAKLMYIVPDEETGAEKKTANFVLVQASSFEEAVKLVISEMGKTAIDYEINTVQETAYMDVYRFESKSGSESQTAG